MVMTIAFSNCRGIAPIEGTESMSISGVASDTTYIAEALPRLRGLKEPNSEPSLPGGQHCRGIAPIEGTERLL